MMNRSNSSETCQQFLTEENLVYNYITIPALILVIALSFLEKRKQLCLNRCGGRPSVLSPINFIDEDRRNVIMYMACFVLVEKIAESIVLGQMFWNPLKEDDVKWMKKYGWLKTFILLLNVAQLCIIVYPLMACIKLRKHLFANAIGISYLIIWIYRQVAGFIACPLGRHYYSQDVNEQLNEDIKNMAAVNQVISNIPRTIAEVILLISFCCDLFMNTRNIIVRWRQRTSRNDDNIALDGEDNTTLKPPYLKYVEALLQRKTLINKQKTFLDKIRYVNVEGFQYSPRLLCTMVFCGMLLFVITSAVTTYLHILFYWIEHNQNIQSDYYTAIKVSAYLGIYASLVLHLFYLNRVVICYRKHMLQYFKGDRSWHHSRRVSPMYSIVQSMKFPGYQVASMLYGYLAVLIFLALFSMCIAFVIVLPLKHGKPILIDISTYWPLLLLTIVIYILQLFLTRMLFLQDKRTSIALDNRNIYQVFSFFMFFYNMVVGLFAILKRIFFSTVLSIFLISRVDKCLVIRGTEFLDPGFNAYVGMLQVEEQHNHPVLRTFIYLLCQSVEQKRQENTVDQYVNIQCVADQSYKYCRSNRWKNRWLKAVTLINNPMIRSYEGRDVKKISKSHVVENIIDKITICAAGCTCIICIGTEI